MMIFGNICQIVRKRCRMIKQMRKKAHLEEKYLFLGGFCPKTWKKSNFFVCFAALRFLSCWFWPKKAYFTNIHPMLLGHHISNKKIFFHTFGRGGS